QELRYAGRLTDWADLLIGGFYTRETYPSTIEHLAVDPATGAIAGTWWQYESNGRFREYAGFGNLTLRASDRFDIQFGARLSRINFRSGPTRSEGVFSTRIAGSPTPVVTTPQFQATDTAFTYLITPRFRINPDLMVYARFASGYRPGGPNESASVINA